MTWNDFHSRGEILRSVTEAADARLDGRLPLDVEGVEDVFDDELDLLGALQLTWHTRLAGRIDRALMNQPLDLDAAVIDAWRATAEELPGYVERVVRAYVASREPGEAFAPWAHRVDEEALR